MLFLCCRSSLWTFRSYIDRKKNTARCTTDSGGIFLTSKQFSAKHTIRKPSVDHKCLQLKEGASGIIDKLSPKYNGTRRILHQLLRVPAITGWIVRDLWESVIKSTDICSNFKTKKKRGGHFLLEWSTSVLIITAVSALSNFTSSLTYFFFFFFNPNVWSDFLLDSLKGHSDDSVIHSYKKSVHPSKRYWNEP